LGFGQIEHRTILAFLALAVAAPVHGEDATIELGYRQMYNLQFDQAHQTFRQWEASHKAEALGPVSDAAAYLFAELDRMHILESEFFTDNTKFFGERPKPDPSVKSSFEKALERGSALAGATLARDPTDVETLFADQLNHGLRADYLSLIERSQIAALGETKKSRQVADRLLAARPDYYDAHLATGIENYLLSLKPAPLRWLLRATGAQTDRQEGLEKLKLTAEKGKYLMPFARLLLAVAALRDRDFATAREYLTWLTREFPLNRLYREELKKLHE